VGALPRKQLAVGPNQFRLSRPASIIFRHCENFFDSCGVREVVLFARGKNDFDGIDGRNSGHRGATRT